MFTGEKKQLTLLDFKETGKPLFTKQFLPRSPSPPIENCMSFEATLDLEPFLFFFN